MNLTSGTHLGPYEVIAAIGAGGMGEVYRARDPRIDRDVAIKILPAIFASNPDRLSRFEREAKTTGSLNHPNLLVVFDFGTHEGSPYLVTEYLEGETLRQRLERGTVPVRKAVAWATQIAEGVAAAHEKGIIHRDIKPENVFLSRDERVKLLDFGLAKLLADDVPEGDDGETRARQTDAGTVLGTPGYMAPEQVRGEAIDERADIFALGIVLAELTTGVHPFQRPTRVEMMSAILQSDPALGNAMPEGLAQIIEHMLAKNVASRFQSMGDVGFALRLLSGSHASGETSATVRSARESVAHERDFLSLTLRRGRISNARFADDGAIIYGAAWEGNPVEIFHATAGTLEARSLGIPGADLLSVSTTGDLAVSLGRRFLGGWASIGTLARVRTAGGGAPRKLHERVVDADWARDGKGMAIIRQADDSTFILECPIGRPLRISGGWLSSVRFSRDGTRLALIDHPWFGDDAGRPVVIDLEGHEVMAPDEALSSTSGLAWSPDGDEVWIAGDRPGYGRDILGYDMTGERRTVLSSPGELTLCDVRADGAILMTHDTWRREVYAGSRGEPGLKNLAWYDWPFPTALSADGNEVLLEEQRASLQGSRSPFFLRPVDGGPAIHMGNGRARGISPDGQWIAAETGATGYLELIPTGVGESRLLKVPCAEPQWWEWFPDGKRLLVLGVAGDQSRLSLAVPTDGSEVTKVGPGNLTWPCAASPDGERIIATGPDDRLMVFPTRGGGDAIPVPGTRRGDWPICWSADANHVYVYPRGTTSLSVDRIDLTTGDRIVWQEIRPTDGAGIVDIFPVWLTADGERYAYSYRRCLSDLYLVESHGLKDSRRP